MTLWVMNDGRDDSEVPRVTHSPCTRVVDNKGAPLLGSYLAVQSLLGFCRVDRYRTYKSLLRERYMITKRIAHHSWQEMSGNG